MVRAVPTHVRCDCPCVNGHGSGVRSQTRNSCCMASRLRRLIETHRKFEPWIFVHLQAPLERRWNFLLASARRHDNDDDNDDDEFEQQQQQRGTGIKFKQQWRRENCCSREGSGSSRADNKSKTYGKQLQDPEGADGKWVWTEENKRKTVEEEEESMLRKTVKYLNTLERTEAKKESEETLEE